MKTLKSRQRGHGSYGFLIGLIAAIPYILAVAAVAAVVAIIWWVRR